MRIKPVLIVFSFMVVCLCGRGQSLFPAERWQYIDSSISLKKNLTDFQQQLLQMKDLAGSKRDDPALARCFFSLLRIRDIKTEDSFYFRNASFMDSLLRDPQSTPLMKSMMHLLLAKRINEFDLRFYYRANKNLIRSYDPLTEYGRMNKEQLDSIIRLHLDSAILLSKSLHPADPGEWLWLSSDPLTFLFKPDFTDLLYAEKLLILQGSVTAHDKPADVSWLSESQDEFIRNGEEIKSLSPAEKRLFRYYKEWIGYHQPSDPEAVYFIETLARKFFYHRITEDSAAERAYTVYLENLLSSVYHPVVAHAVYQLCTLWETEASRYNRTPVRPMRSYPGNTGSFDSTYRLYYNKSLQLFARNENQLDSFLFIKNALLGMRSSILAPGITLITEGTRIPDKPVPVFLKYRNTSRLYTRVIRVNFSEESEPDLQKKISRLIGLPYLAEQMQELNLPDDHQWHNTFLKWNALPVGHYIVLYSDTLFTGKTDRVKAIRLDLTRMAVINNDQRVFVLNRESGFPLQGASVIATVRLPQKSGKPGMHIEKDLAPRIVNAQGYVLFPEKNIIHVRVYNGKDSCLADVNQNENKIPGNLYNKDDFDDLAAFYEENIRLELFTDRSIYRPGQTVFYKGIFTVQNPQTGEIEPLNWQNLQFSVFKKLLYRIAIKFSKRKIGLRIEDPFNRVADSVHILPNKFGSFSGSFQIPKNAATGEWSFDQYADDDLSYEISNANSGQFRVEEYKRPSFRLVLEKPKKELQLTDTFSIKIQAKSYAGALLNHVLIKYTVTASGTMPVRNEHSGKFEFDYRQKEVLSGQAYTNDKGELIVSVNDSSLALKTTGQDQQVSQRYEIKAEAIDETGENHEESLSFSLSNRPIEISLPLGGTMDRQEIKPISISTKNEFAGAVQKPLDIIVYRIREPANQLKDRSWPPTDLTVFPKDSLESWFPEIDFGAKTPAPEEKEIVYRTSLAAAADKKLTLPRELLRAGHYQIEILSRENSSIRGELKKYFSVFDKKENALPEKTYDFNYLPETYATAGDTLDWITGNSEKDVFSIYHATLLLKRKTFSLHYDYEIRSDKKGLNSWQYKIPSGAAFSLLLTHLYIINNRLYRQERRITLVGKDPDRPEIIIEHYRTQLAPGEKQIFSVSVKTKNAQAAAELMTTMYDAALDKLQPHSWTIPEKNTYFYPGSAWDRTINSTVSSELYLWGSDLRPNNSSNEKPVWWLPAGSIITIPGYFSYETNGGMYGNGSKPVMNMLSGRAAGVTILNPSDLDDAVVVGYGVAKKQNLTGAVVSVRGISSLGSYTQPLIILDGLPFTGSLDQLNAGSITQAIVLKGADAEALYGTQAANGVLILSTKGDIVLPTPKPLPPPPLVIRKNFSESAFFYPQMHADKNGFYTIPFTLPESVTEWRWKLFAHTVGGRFAYAEKSLVSQLPLMVQPALPRFFYQGDQMILKTRISNLDTNDLSGQLKCRIEDAVTGEDITTGLVAGNTAPFRISRESNTTVSFTITIPENFLHPLRIRISGTTATFSDGEEHTIPVLSKKFLISKTTALRISDHQRVSVQTPLLPDNAEAYGLRLFINPKPYAALLNALPSLAYDPYHCSEQTLNKLLARFMAIQIARTDTGLISDQDEKDSTSNLPPEESNDEFPGKQTMPWLQLNQATAIQHRQLKKLFDTVTAHREIEKYFSELLENQNPDGGISWFKGGTSDFYISGYLLAGLGKIVSRRLLFLDNNQLENEFPAFIARLIAYGDAQLLRERDFANPADYLYARSYWLSAYPLSEQVKKQADSLIRHYWIDQVQTGLYGQATQIIIALRFTGKSDTCYRLALKALESLRQSAINDEQNGLRWKDISNSDDLNRCAEETVVRVAEAFETGGNAAETIAGMVKWLLNARQDHAWSTTKATAGAIDLLSRQPAPEKNTEAQELTMDSLSVSNALTGGKLSAFRSYSGKAFPPDLPLKNEGSSVNGGISYYYFTTKPEADSANNKTQIEKALFKYNDSADSWEPVTKKTRLKTGDRIRTELTITSSRQISYVIISDHHAAALEPGENQSGYQYEKQFSYYQSVKDDSYLFFSDRIPSGIYHISYETRISAEGSFTNGPASLECMYQPAIRAYSNSNMIEVTH